MADIVGESEATEKRLDLKDENKYHLPRTSHNDWRTADEEMKHEIDCEPAASESNSQKELKFTDEENFMMQEIEESIEETQITPDIFDIEGKTYYLDDILGSHSSDECYPEESLTSDEVQHHKKSLKKKKNKVTVPNKSNSPLGQDSNFEEFSGRSTKGNCMKMNTGKNMSDGDNPNVGQRATAEVRGSNF